MIIPIQSMYVVELFTYILVSLQLGIVWQIAIYSTKWIVMIHLLYRAILIHNHSYAAKMVFLVIMERRILAIVEGTIATIEEILVKLTIFKYEVTDVVGRVCHDWLMSGSQLIASSIIDILRLEAIVESDALQVAKNIILYIADALVQVLDQCTVDIVEILCICICSILEIKGTIIE